ncbi:DUF4184 family protein [Streptomyces sp. MI02-7b]|uniref:DUF4184 family protein n=1 Tax=Streptomyces sp. MI02-7b TaxID=462941 RepID=UPI0029B7D359|nr:DUF4184 family protein [Streptomyces sp. MI02-7b]MDX3074330.1 DUF4184 family protein [Streptomyces sp. MI02-7b]
MPFTLSHALAVVPGLRRDRHGTPRGRGPLVAAALVAGSFAPDVPYFAESLVSGVYGYGTFTHAPLGLVTGDPLIAAALAGGWVLLREPLVALLPERSRDRVAAITGCGDRRRPTLRSAAAFWASAAAGAATHVVWDAFTHHDRWGVRLLPVLDRQLHGTPLHKYAQYGSSAVALAVLAGYAVRALRAVPEPDADWDSAENRGRPLSRVPRLSPRARAVALTAIGATTVAAAAVRAGQWYRATGDAAGIIPSGLFGAGAGLALAATACAGAVRLAYRTGEGTAQCAADSQSVPTPTETSSGARRG